MVHLPDLLQIFLAQWKKFNSLTLVPQLLPGWVDMQWCNWLLAKHMYHINAWVQQHLHRT